MAPKTYHLHPLGAGKLFRVDLMPDRVAIGASIRQRDAGWWRDRLGRLIGAGVSGFRCLQPDRVQVAVRQIAAAGEA